MKPTDQGLKNLNGFSMRQQIQDSARGVFNAEAWEGSNKVIGTPVNIKFGQLFKIEKMTILGEATDNLKEKLKP